MVRNYIYRIILGLMIFLPVAGNSRIITDTIKPLPFLETWDSASFTTNAWTFPSGQVNWAISSSEGYPPPSAVFNGIPAINSYNAVLQSPWVEGRGLSCDWLYIDFDLKLESLNNTGQEQLQVILQFNNSFRTLQVFTNSESANWTHFHYNITAAVGSLFRIRFVVAGQNSADISKWLIDSVSFTRECRPPRGLVPYGGHGSCSSNNPTCFPNMMWGYPDCSDYYSTSFVYDDGSFELQVGLSGNPGCFGNYFPLPAGASGYLTSFDFYFRYISGTSLTFSLYDSTRNLIYTSSPFYPWWDSWTNIPVDSLPLNGPFYAMVYENGQDWDALGMDTTGPYSGTDLAWSNIGGNWAKISTFGFPESVLSIRANALVPYKKAQAPEELKDPGKPDTSNLIGYNVYRKREFVYPDSAFIKINSVPLILRQYSDSIPCQAEYYVTAVYSNDCESGPSNTFTANPCWLGIDGVNSPQLVRVSPNPANTIISVHSELKVESVTVSDYLGNESFTQNTGMARDFQLDVSALSPGLYILRLKTQTSRLNTKIIIMH